MRVPLLDLKAQYTSIRDEVRAAIDRVLESQHFILGAEVQALEAEIAAYTQSCYGIGVSSGTDALLLCLMVLELQPGDEVITTPYTFFATASAIARVGARPIFVDIDPRTYNLDAAAVEAAITPRTRAIIPVHLFGQMTEMGGLMALAEKFNLTVIEDAAQAIGAEQRGQRAGTVGQMACFSFFPSKNLGGVGDGGMVTTNDPQLNERLRLYRNHGYAPKYYNKVIGGNFRLDEIQAAVLRVKLPYLDRWTETRRRNAALYRRLFIETGCVTEDLEALDQAILLPQESAQNRHIYNQFVIQTSRRDALQADLKAQGIGTEVYYPCPMHLQECFAYLSYREGDFPHSERAARETLALPIYPELTEAMQRQVVQAVATFLAKG